MARSYFSQLPDTNTVNVTMAGLTSATTIRPKIYEFVWGSEGTPADQAARYIWQRYTAAGTSTAFTPVAIDPVDPAALAAAGFNHSAEPTYTSNAIIFSMPLNQRASFRWIAAPGKELVLPATAANGAGFYATVVTSAFAVTLGLYHEE